MAFLFKDEEVAPFEETSSLYSISLASLLVNQFDHSLFSRMGHITFLFGFLNYYFETHGFINTDFTNHYS